MHRIGRKRPQRSWTSTTASDAAASGSPDSARPPAPQGRNTVAYERDGTVLPRSSYCGPVATPRRYHGGYAEDGQSLYDCALTANAIVARTASLARLIESSATVAAQTMAEQPRAIDPNYPVRPYECALTASATAARAASFARSIEPSPTSRTSLSPIVSFRLTLWGVAFSSSRPRAVSTHDM